MKFINLVKKLNLPTGQYLVFGSGPLHIHGIRETRDIDICVKPEVYEELKSTGEWEEKTYHDGSRYLSKDMFEIVSDWDYGEKYCPTVSELIERAEIIEGIPFAPLEDVLNWKKAYARPKDLEDVKLIKAYLKTK
jgi:hypothetical protein